MVANLVNPLVYRIEVQARVNVQVEEFLKINKRAGETSCKDFLNVQDLRCINLYATSK